MTELVTAWITKYALTNGIMKVDGRLPREVSGMIVYRTPKSHYEQYAHENEWHLTEAEAMARAEEMRTKNIAALHKSIEKLEKMRFVP